MRHESEQILKEELRALAIVTRDRQGITQKQMAQKLMMGETSYSDIETGESGCGTLTAILLLSQQEAPTDLIRQMTQKIQQLYEKEMRST